MKTYVLIPYIPYPNAYSLSYFSGSNRFTCGRAATLFDHPLQSQTCGSEISLKWNYDTFRINFRTSHDLCSIHTILRYQIHMWIDSNVLLPNSVGKDNDLRSFIFHVTVFKNKHGVSICQDSAYCSIPECPIILKLNYKVF